MDNEILELLKTMQKDIEGIKANQEESNQMLRAIDERTKVLSAESENAKHERAEIAGEVAAIRKDLSNVEVITANNWADIARLKAK